MRDTVELFQVNRGFVAPKCALAWAKSNLDDGAYFVECAPSGRVWFEKFPQPAIAYPGNPCA